MSRAGWHVRANAPLVAWLLALLVVAWAGPLIAQSRWLMVHLLLLGAVSNAVVVWSGHFAAALLRTPGATSGRRTALVLTALNAGAVLVVVGVLTGRWPATAVGATGVGVAAVVHGGSLLVQARLALPSRFGATIRYYVAAAAALPVGAALGAALGRRLGDGVPERVVVAHAATNVLGWVGLTVVGTLVTLWPTMLRTRVADGAELAARRALPVLIGSLAVVGAGALVGVLPVTAVGLAGYLGGLALAAEPLVREARARPPRTFATWSVLAGCSWWAASLAWLVIQLAVAPSWSDAAGRLYAVTVPLTAGFAVQVLLGALTYLIPVVLGGGPYVARRTAGWLERWWALRVTVVNVALALALLPLPGRARTLCWVLVVVGLGSFLPLLAAALVAFRRAQGEPAPTARPARATPEQLASDNALANRRAWRQVNIGLVLVAVVVAAGAALALW